jgi:hypothetical protein
MSLDNIKDSDLSLAPRQQLLNDMSSEETTSSNHQIRFALGHFFDLYFVVVVFLAVMCTEIEWDVTVYEL